MKTLKEVQPNDIIYIYAIDKECIGVSLEVKGVNSSVGAGYFISFDRQIFNIYFPYYVEYFYVNNGYIYSTIPNMEDIFVPIFEAGSKEVKSEIKKILEIDKN